MVNNTKYGSGALQQNSGINNTAIGAYASYNNLDASNNTAVGSNSAFFNTTGSNNTSLGSGSICNNTTGALNTAIGSSALEGVVGQSVGNQNVAVGAQSLYVNGGSLNTAIGTYAAEEVDGSYNTFLGAYTSFDDPSASYQYSTAIGYGALIDASNQIMMGGTGQNGYPNVVIPGKAFLPNFSFSNVSETQIVPKEYVDTVSQGLAPKAPCSCIANYDVSLNPTLLDVTLSYSTPFIIDNYQTKANDRVLINNQGTPDTSANILNGIYDVSYNGTNYYWIRSTDMPIGSDALGAYTFIENGTKYQATSWVQSYRVDASGSPVIVGTNPLYFTKYGGFPFRIGRGLDTTISATLTNINVDTSLNFIDFLDSTAGAIQQGGATGGSGTLNIGNNTTQTIIGPTGATRNPVIFTSGVTGPTGSFTNLSASRQILAPAGISGATGSFTNLSASQQILAPAGISGATGSFNNVLIGDVSQNSVGQLLIYETTGRGPYVQPSGVTGATPTYSFVPNAGTLVLNHNNRQGTSSIVFPSNAGGGEGGDCAYIQYFDNVGGVNENSLLLIGIENDLSQDRISLYADSGNGKVGINTMNPAYNLDVSGNTNVRGNLTVSGSIVGATGSFTNLSASQQILAPAGITGTIGSFTNLSVSQQFFAQRGISGATGSFANLSASQQILAPAGISGATGSFTSLSASQQILAPAGISGATGSFTNLSASRQILASAGISGTTGSFANLSASQQILAPAGITGTIGSFTNLSASSGITGGTGSFSYISASQQIVSQGGIVVPNGLANYTSYDNSDNYSSTTLVPKQYVDQFVSGINVKEPVDAFENVSSIDGIYDSSGVGSITGVSNSLTVDGVVILDGSSVLLNKQTNLVENGVYIWQSGTSTGTLTRRNGMQNDESAKGDYVFVIQGTNYKKTAWVQVNDPAIVGTDPLNFVQFSYYDYFAYQIGRGLDVTNSGGVTYINVDTSLNFINFLDSNTSVGGNGTLALGTFTTNNIIIGPTGSSIPIQTQSIIQAQKGITGGTGSFTNLSASRQILAPAGISGATGSFTNLSASQQILAPAGISGATGSFTNLSASQQILAPAGITGTIGSFTNLSASQQILAPEGISGATGSFSYISSSQQIVSQGGIVVPNGLANYTSYDNSDNYSSTTLVPKQYVDQFQAGISVKAPVTAISLSDISGNYNNDQGTITGLSNSLTVDSAVILDGSSVLLNGQTNPVENGVYTWQPGTSTGTLTRRIGMQNNEPAQGAYIFVMQGTNYKNTAWVQVNNPAIVGTDPLNFAQFSNYDYFDYQLGRGLDVTNSGGVTYINVDTSLNFINFLDSNTSVGGNGTLAIGTFSTNNIVIGPTGTSIPIKAQSIIQAQKGITGGTGSFSYISASSGITGATGSFTNLTASRQILAPAGISGATGSFTNLSASQQISAPAGITGTIGSFTNLSISQQFLTPAGITGATGSFTNLTASQQILAPSGISGATGSFTNLSASQQISAPAGITGTIGSFTNLSISQQISAPAGITGTTGSFTNLSASQQISAPAGITGTIGSFTNLSISQQFLAPAGITGATGSFNNVTIGNVGQNSTGQLRIYETIGSGPYLQTGSANPTINSTTTGSLVINHNNAGGTSSIVFPSNINNAGGECAYIQYFDNVGTAGGEAGLLLIGIENNASQDRISLYPDNGSGSVGINTIYPSTGYSLDVSGNTHMSGNGNISGNLTVGNVGLNSTGQIRIYETTGSGPYVQNLSGSNPTFNSNNTSTGSLVINHNNGGGTSSIVFPSYLNNTDCAYIQYFDNVGPTGSNESGLLLIGIENDASEDRISLYPDNGTGNVGINTMNPAYNLDVNGTLRTTAASYLASNSGNVGIGTISPGYKLDVNGQFRTTADSYLASSSGSVGIGTISPNSAYKLDVNGNTHTSGNLTVGNVGLNSTGQLRIYETTGSGPYVQTGSANPTFSSTSTGSLVISHNNTQGTSSILFQSNAGGLQGGDCAYIQYFDNVGTGTSEAGLLLIGIENDASEDRISLYPDNGTGNVGINTMNPAYNLDVNGTLRTTAASYLASSSGNVGIGTIGPAYKLDVNGQFRTTADSYLASSSGSVGIGTISPNYKLDVNGSANVSGNAILGSTNVSGNAFLASSTSGSVGIGTTSPGYKLDVNGSARFRTSMSYQGQMCGWFNNNAISFYGPFYYIVCSMRYLTGWGENTDDTWWVLPGYKFTIYSDVSYNYYNQTDGIKFTIDNTQGTIVNNSIYYKSTSSVKDVTITFDSNNTGSFDPSGNISQSPNIASSVKVYYCNTEITISGLS